MTDFLSLLGIVVSLTLKLDKMTYARWQPKKANMSKALPRPCSRLKQQNGTKTEEGGNKAESEEKAENVKRLNQLIEDSFYTEFFWFPNNGIDEGYWENCFKVHISAALF